MRLWLSRGSDVSVRDQLVTQVILSILSGDLEPGERLPSTRELARRFHVHANTVSAGYRKLQSEGWVEFRKGSGVYVRQTAAEKVAGASALDQMIAEFLARARKLGTPLSVIRDRVKHWLELQPPDHFLLIEPDAELAHIVKAELHRSLRLPVLSCTPMECISNSALETAIPMILSLKERDIRKVLPREKDVLTLQLRSAAGSLAPYLPVPASALVAVASTWPPFLKTARTMLIAAGFDSDSLMFRDATKPNWRRGLEQTSAVICDLATAQKIDGSCRVLGFPLLADATLKELRAYEEFLLDPVSG